MSKLLDLMTRRARAQHQLDLLRSRGRRAGEKRPKARDLKARIKGLTAEINALLARRRQKAAREARRRSSRSRRTRTGPHGEGDGLERSIHQRESGPRERARRLRRAATLRFRSRDVSARSCTTCRPATMAARSNEWTVIRDESWPPTGGISANCREFQTDLGDELDINVVIQAGPAPPGPTFMEVRIYVDGNKVYDELLGDGSHPIPFVSPGGTIRVCAYVGWPGDAPHNWDSDDNGYVNVRQRRRKPNLVALGPHIWWDEQWVGYGYRVENNHINHGDPLVGLYYGKRHENGNDVVLNRIRERATSRDDGKVEDWNTNPGDFRVPFSAMEIPPDEATHMVCAVDLDRTVDELDENDNLNWHELPRWAAALEWVDLSLQRAPASLPRGASDPAKRRLMRVYPLRVRARQEIWKWMVAARERCSLRVFVKSDRDGDAEALRGWVFPPSMRPSLAGSRINVGASVKVHEKHPPVNELREARSPRGAVNSQSPYLFIPCSQLDRGTGEVDLLYIPATQTGADEIRVELWDDVLNQPVNAIGSSEVAAITRSIVATIDYTLEWVRKPPARLASSFLSIAGLTPDQQPQRHVVPEPLKLRATVNGVPVAEGERVDFWIDATADEPATGDEPRGWIFPRKKFWTSLVTKALLNVRSRSGFPGVTEPLAAGSAGGVGESRRHKLKTNSKSEISLWYIPPSRGGADAFHARLRMASGSSRPKVVASAPVEVVELLRYGLRSLRLVSEQSPTAASLSRMLPGAVGSATALPGSADFAFAPGPGVLQGGGLAQTPVDPVKIEYELADKLGLVSRARLSILRDGDATPIFTRDLGPGELKDGKHVLQVAGKQSWDGSIDQHSDFPDRSLTVEHSPYTLRLDLLESAGGTCDSPRAWTDFRVKLAGLELELGPVTATWPDQGPVDVRGFPVQRGSHRAVLMSLGGAIPAPGGSVDVVLDSNQFKQTTGEMSDRTAFLVHEAAWGEGPRLPVFARLRTLNSGGIAVDAPRSLGFVSCLWDWEDRTSEAVSIAAIASGTAKAFVKDALDFDVSASRPSGRTCHAERGGKRDNAPSGKAVFPQQNGYGPADQPFDGVFPFRVYPGTTRWWAAFSDVWTSGIHAGKTGVPFELSRMAGDVFGLRCYVAGKLPKGGPDPFDTDQDPTPAAEFIASTGDFRMQRNVVMPTYVKKRPFAFTANMAQVTQYFGNAPVVVTQTYGLPSTMSSQAFNDAFKAAAASQLNEIANCAIDPAVDQHAAGDYFAHFRSYNDFLSAVMVLKGNDYQTWLNTHGSTYTQNNYEKGDGLLGEWSMALLPSVCDALWPKLDGVTVFHFLGLHNIAGGGSLNGWAAMLPSQTRRKVGLILCGKPAGYVPGSTFNTLEQTATHEIGHHLFMPHTPDIGGVAAFHDPSEVACVMSYSFDIAVRNGCGLCLLRLRGWDSDQLSNVSANNRRP